MSQAKLVKLLLDGTHSCAELAASTGLHYMTVLDYTRHLHREGAAHIAEFRADTRGRDSIKVYKLGPGKDAKRYALSAAERTKRYRKNVAARQLQAALTLRPACAASGAD